VLHAGGKFGGGGYKVASGLHGVGVSAVNALSRWLEVRCATRAAATPSATSAASLSPGRSTTDRAKGHGTTTRFLPDDEIMHTLDYRFKTLAQRFREMAFLTRGLTIHFEDERDGLRTDLSLRGRHPVVCALPQPHPQACCTSRSMSRAPSRARPSRWPCSTPMAMPSRCCLCQQHQHVDGGTHLTGFRSALTRSLNDYARSHGLLKDKDENFPVRTCARG
jgi:DNA gyrase subunit B